jgi:hypothetical protein
MDQKYRYSIRCGSSMRIERAYFEGKRLRIELRAAVLVKTYQNRKKRTAPVVPQRAVIRDTSISMRRLYLRSSEISRQKSSAWRAISCASCKISQDLQFEGPYWTNLRFMQCSGPFSQDIWNVEKLQEEMQLLTSCKIFQDLQRSREILQEKHDLICLISFLGRICGEDLERC